MSALLARVILKRGREGPVRGGNPWIFSQAIARIEPAAAETVAGGLVAVHDDAGTLLGMGYINPATTIAVRMLAWGETPAIDELVVRRLRGALDLRRKFVRADTDAYRLVNGDGDGLSGVVVDRFGDVLVVQLLTAGADRLRAEPGRGRRREVRRRARRVSGRQDRSNSLCQRAGIAAIGGPFRRGLWRVVWKGHSVEMPANIWRQGSPKHPRPAHTSPRC